MVLMKRHLPIIMIQNVCALNDCQFFIACISIPLIFVAHEYVENELKTVPAGKIGKVWQVELN